MSRRAIGITSYYNRVTPVYPATKPRTVKRDKPPGIRELTLDVPEPEIREQEKEDAFSRQISIASQALFCFAIILLFLNIINQVIKFCF